MPESQRGVFEAVEQARVEKLSAHAGLAGCRKKTSTAMAR